MRKVVVDSGWRGVGVLGGFAGRAALVMGVLRAAAHASQCGRFVYTRTFLSSISTSDIIPHCLSRPAAATTPPSAPPPRRNINFLTSHLAPMARLNEAPPPQESVDQRMFTSSRARATAADQLYSQATIHQTKSRARKVCLSNIINPSAHPNVKRCRNNSTQSVRIRALETEQARLLAENLYLREQIIQLQTELEHNKGHHALQQITSVKDQLESKLMEIGSLVAELNSIQKPSYKTRPSDGGPSKAVEHFEWRRAMKEQAGEQDDDEALPTIREDKYFPRRTLEYVDTTLYRRSTQLMIGSADELRAVLTTTTDDSPDLGPPPVAHFPDEDPIKFDPKPAAEEANDDMDVDQKENEPLPANVSVNLETRRKRRDSSKLDLRKMSVFQSPDEEDAAMRGDFKESQPSKMGRKRKLSATAEETNGDANEKDYRDDFRFSRRGGDRENRQPLETSYKQNAKLDMLLNTERKALGDSTSFHLGPRGSHVADYDYRNQHITEKGPEIRLQV